MTTCRTHVPLCTCGARASHVPRRDRLDLRTETFVARIGMSNACSIALFAALGFIVVRTIAVFDEVAMQIVDSGEIS